MKTITVIVNRSRIRDDLLLPKVLAENSFYVEERKT